MLWVRQHPFPRYVATGAIVFAIDLLGLRVLHGSLGVNLIVATVVAYLIAFVVNFTLSRHWTFRTADAQSRRRHATRYTVVVLVNLAVTVAIVAGLVDAGMNYLIAKVVSAAAIAIVNFFVSRRWVFT
jgi:putative flippase GtrA